MNHRTILYGRHGETLKPALACDRCHERPATTITLDRSLKVELCLACATAEVEGVSC